MNIILKLNFLSFEAVKPLGRVEIVPSPYVTESTRVALLLPTFEHQTKETMDFISHYEKTCMEHQDNTFLMLVIKVIKIRRHSNHSSWGFFVRILGVALWSGFTE